MEEAIEEEEEEEVLPSGLRTLGIPDKEVMDKLAEEGESEEDLPSSLFLSGDSDVLPPGVLPVRARMSSLSCRTKFCSSVFLYFTSSLFTFPNYFHTLLEYSYIL